MTRVMVALVGAQALPNVLPVKAYRPDAILFVYSARTRLVYDRLCATLGPATAVHGLETDAYDILRITAALRERLGVAGLSDAALTFNLTGGTKAMSLAAYEVARERGAPVLYLESEGRQSHVYHYAWAGGELDATGDEVINPDVTLHDLLDLGYGPGMWKAGKPDLTQKGGPFEQALADALRPHVDELLTAVRAMTGNIDLDLAVRLGNQFAIIEAKSGDGGRNLEGVKQLNTAGQQLGTYTQRLYVITVKPERSHEALKDAARIATVALLDQPRDATVLRPEAAAEFVATVKRRLVGDGAARDYLATLAPAVAAVAARRVFDEGV